MTPDISTHHPAATRQSLARSTLLAFILTFILTRVLVFLIMARRLPDLYVHLGGTHVHHLNYGIFLLTGVGAYFRLSRTPTNDALPSRSSGVGVALTFDEFGMWLHLGGSYWQRASFDAVIVLAALLGLAAFMPPLAAWRPRHARTAIAVLAAAAIFYHMLARSFRFAAEVAPRLEQLEQRAPQ